MKYTLITEDKNRRKVEKIIGKYFEGFTIQEGIGYYKGIKEKSIAIIIFTEDVWSIVDQINIKAIVENIKRINEQECVLVTMEDDVEAKFF